MMSRYKKSCSPSVIDLSVVYTGCDIITCTGTTIENGMTLKEIIILLAQDCYEPESVSWGDIIGDIEDQTDLIDFIQSQLPSVSWGNISGDINEQTDLTALIESFVPGWGELTGDIESQQDLINYLSDNFYDKEVIDNKINDVAAKSTAEYYRLAEGVTTLPTSPEQGGIELTNAWTWLVPGVTYTVNGVEETTPNDRSTRADWDGSSWSLVDMGELPSTTGVDVLDPEGEAIPKEKAVANYIKPLFDNKRVDVVTEDILPQLDIRNGWLRVTGNVEQSTMQVYFDYFPVKEGDIFVITNFGNEINTRTNLLQYDLDEVPVATYGSNFGKTANPDGSYTNTYTITQDGFVRGGAAASGGFVSIVATLTKEFQYYATPQDLENFTANFTVQNSNIKEGAVTADKTDMFFTNLVDPNDFTDGLYANNVTGELSSNPSYAATHTFIPIVPGNTYIKSNSNQHWAIYNKEEIFVRGGTATNIIEAGEGEYFVRVTDAPGTKGAFMLVEGEVLPIAYINKGDYKLKYNYMGEGPPFRPRLATPRKLHVLNGQENSFYHKSYTERWLDKFFITGSGTGWQYRSRYFRTNGSASTLTVNLRDTTSLNAISNKTISVTSVSADSPSTALTINVWGDSYTHNGVWAGHANNLLSNLAYVGLRTSYGTPIKAEGRGGWTLERYFVNYKTVDGFSPLMHPTGSTYRYFGVTGFWKQVVAGSSGYQITGFTDRVSQFDANGFPVAPTVNDLMYDSDAATFKAYNGTTWINVAEASLTFECNYGKYLSVWGIDTPNVFAINLGMNDFSGSMISQASWDTWKSRLEILIASVKAAVPNISIAICTHVTIFASDNNTSNENPILKSANLWEGRRRVLEAFDTATWESQSVIVVDVGSALDQDYGWTQTEELPFSDYPGNARELVSSGTPHPSVHGYSQLGVRFAAYLQSVR